VTSLSASFSGSRRALLASGATRADGRSETSNRRLLEPQALVRHLDVLYRGAWALCGRREDAEDLVQEVCARVLARPRVLHGGSERAYLMGVLRHTFYTWHRDAKRRPAVVDAPEGWMPREQRSDALPEAALEISEVLATVSALPRDFRDVLVAVDVLGLSYREASQLLSVPEATITTRLYRARRRVARAMQPELEQAEVAV
jgi:RNA polymerase sigma-70 factor (ECF subfamily)